MLRFVRFCPISKFGFRLFVCSICPNWYFIIDHCYAVCQLCCLYSKPDISNVLPICSMYSRIRFAPSENRIQKSETEKWRLKFILETTRTYRTRLVLRKRLCSKHAQDNMSCTGYYGYSSCRTQRTHLAQRTQHTQHTYIHARQLIQHLTHNTQLIAPDVDCGPGCGVWWWQFSFIMWIQMERGFLLAASRIAAAAMERGFLLAACSIAAAAVLLLLCCCCAAAAAAAVKVHPISRRKSYLPLALSPPEQEELTTAAVAATSTRKCCCVSYYYLLQLSAVWCLDSQNMQHSNKQHEARELSLSLLVLSAQHAVFRLETEIDARVRKNTGKKES